MGQQDMNKSLTQKQVQFAQLSATRCQHHLTEILLDVKAIRSNHKSPEIEELIERVKSVELCLNRVKLELQGRLARIEREVESM